MPGLDGHGTFSYVGRWHKIFLVLFSTSIRLIRWFDACVTFSQDQKRALGRPTQLTCKPLSYHVTIVSVKPECFFVLHACENISNDAFTLAEIHDKVTPCTQLYVTWSPTSARTRSKRTHEHSMQSKRHTLTISIPTHPTQAFSEPLPPEARFAVHTRWPRCMSFRVQALCTCWWPTFLFNDALRKHFIKNSHAQASSWIWVSDLQQACTRLVGDDIPENIRDSAAESSAPVILSACLAWVMFIACQPNSHASQHVHVYLQWFVWFRCRHSMHTETFIYTEKDYASGVIPTSIWVVQSRSLRCSASNLPLRPPGMHISAGMCLQTRETWIMRHLMLLCVHAMICMTICCLW